MSSYETEDSSFTDYDGEIIAAKFEKTDPQFGASVPQIVFTMATDDPQVPTWTERYKLGTTKKGGTWEIVDDDREVIASDLSTRFRDNSGYGKFITAVVKAARINLSTGVDASGRQWGETMKAATWLGARFHMDSVKESFTDRETKEVIEWSKNYPSSYLGHVETATSSGSLELAAESSSAPTVALETFSEVLEPLDEKQIAALITASRSESHGKWVDSAMDIAGEALTNEQWRAKFISDISSPDGLYETLKRS